MTTLAVVAGLVGFATFRAGASDKPVGQKSPFFGVEELLDFFGLDQTGIANLLPNFTAEFPVLVTMCAAVIVKVDAKSGEVFLMSLT